MSTFLVVSLNPTYQLIMGYERISEGDVNRTEKWRSEFSGKGVNVARALSKLGNDVTLLTHMNPSRITEFQSQADADGFKASVVEDPSPLRTCVTILQTGSNGIGMTTTELVQESPAIEGSGTEASVLDYYRQILKSVECVIFTGTRSPGYSKNLYPDMAKLAKQAGCYVIMDVKRGDLTGSLDLEPEFRPDIVKPNLAELIQTFGGGFDPLELVENLPCNAVITNGVKGCFIHEVGRELSHIDALRVRSQNTTGCGDAFTAAMADSLMKGSNLLAACHAGIRAGALKAQEEPF